MHIMFGDRTLIRDLSRNDLIGKLPTHTLVSSLYAEI